MVLPEIRVSPSWDMAIPEVSLTRTHLPVQPDQRGCRVLVVHPAKNIMVVEDPRARVGGLHGTKDFMLPSLRHTGGGHPPQYIVPLVLLAFHFPLLKSLGHVLPKAFEHGNEQVKDVSIIT